MGNLYHELHCSSTSDYTWCAVYCTFDNERHVCESHLLLGRPSSLELMQQCCGVFFLCDWVTPVMGGHVTIRIVAWSDVNSVTGKYSLV